MRGGGKVEGQVGKLKVGASDQRPINSGVRAPWVARVLSSSDAWTGQCSE
jgi:hypothetical protein